MRDRRRLLRRGLGFAVAAPFMARWPAALAGTTDRLVGAAAGPVLGPILAANRDKHPGRRGSNHLSMALLSLAALGGTERQLKDLGEEGLRRGGPFPKAGPVVTAQSWLSFRGNQDALPGLRALFTREIGQRGVASTLRAYLPQLLPGLGAHAFHAIIRTGYGVRFGDPDEVAMGLAYWAVTYLPLGPLGTPAGKSDPATALARVSAWYAGLPAQQSPGDLNIAGKMQWVSTFPGFAAVASSLRADDIPLAAIAATMVRLYLGSDDNFTALHAVTGTHAYRMLAPFIVDGEAGRRHLWQALVAAYVSMKAPAGALAKPAGAPAPPWTEVVARAMASADDHKLKLSDIAREESRHYGGDEIYRRAAAIHVELV